MGLDLHGGETGAVVGIDHNLLAPLKVQLASQIVIDMSHRLQANAHDLRWRRQIIKRILLVHVAPCLSASLAASHKPSACSRELAIAPTAVAAVSAKSRIIRI